MSRGGLKVPNLLFADDLVPFAEASNDQAYIFKDCLECFCRASGQKVNSIYFSPNTQVHIVANICSILGMSNIVDLRPFLAISVINWSDPVTETTYR